MVEAILQDFVEKIEKKISEMKEELRKKLDFSKIEQALSKIANELVASLLQDMLSNLLKGREFLDELKQLGAKLAMRFKEYRKVTLYLANAETIRINVPYFIKASPKKGRKKRGPNGRGSFLGLEVLGFIERCSSNFVSEVVQSAILCPSYEIAKSVLSRRGIEIDVKTIRRLCQKLGNIGLSHRGRISLDGTENLEGHTLVIGIDGGRLRERRNKRGRKKQGQKRQGYYTDWKEPKLFTLYLLNAKGEIIKEFAPLHDATMGDHHQMFDVLKQYLDALDLSKVNKVVFCGDGAPWIWSGVENLLPQLGLDLKRVYQIIDYTHAKQNLQEIINLVSIQSRQEYNIDKRWKEMLWEGDIVGLYQQICRLLRGKKREQAIKKWNNYFSQNQTRMQYARFKEECLPCGSGCVESAIRRIINLRLKAPGSFWKKEMAECFLFLRSQLLSGRWDLFLRNITHLTRRLVERQQACDDSDISQEWPEVA